MDHFYQAAQSIQQMQLMITQRMQALVQDLMEELLFGTEK